MSKVNIKRPIIYWIALLALLTGSADAAWHRGAEAIMGTQVTVELWHTDAEHAERLIDRVMAEMHRIDQTYSPYIESSQLSVLNRGAASAPVKVSEEMWRLLQAGREMSELSDGAFDLTYASVGRYYDYRAGQRPSENKIAEDLAAIDYRHIVFGDGRQVRYLHPAVYVDLGGIAKGYAVDQSIELLEQAGVEQAIVAAGGDSRILGDRLGKPWSVGVQHPRDKTKMIAVLPLVDTAVSTSGDYERFFEEQGVRYHHILDPGSGDSARGLRSVTILGPRGTFTDALSTAVFVLGVDAGLALIDRLPGIDAIVVDSAGELRYSADIAPLD